MAGDSSLPNQSTATGLGTPEENGTWVDWAECVARGIAESKWLVSASGESVSYNKRGFSPASTGIGEGRVQRLSATWASNQKWVFDLFAPIAIAG